MNTTGTNTAPIEHIFGACAKMRFFNVLGVLKYTFFFNKNHTFFAEPRDS